MSIMALLSPRIEVPEAIPFEIELKLKRGREARDRDKSKRELYRKFWEGEQYWLQTPAGQLTAQSTGPAGVIGPNKPVHRVRNTYNLLQAIIEAKVSAATGQVPGYETTPSTDDPEDDAAASLASAVAYFGYDQWRIRRHTTKVVTRALVEREGFAYPFFDEQLGPFVDGKPKGDIRVLTFSRDEVCWEPDEDFDDSRWHAVEKLRRTEEILKLPGYIPGSLDDPKAKVPSPEKVVLTEFLERPCPDYPEGRRMFFAQGRVVIDARRTINTSDAEAEDYEPADLVATGAWWETFPYSDAQGEIADEPVLHRLSYTVNPCGDDLGLVERLIDLQRTVNDTWNKILEIKNRALMLRMLARQGAQLPRQDDVPGGVSYYQGAEKPEWEQPPNPSFLAQLLEIHREAISEMRMLAADVDIQPEARLAEGTAQLAQTAAQARWQSFLGDLAEFHSRFMRHCLCLVGTNYDTERQIDIRGQYGWQPMVAFKGQDMRSQVNVRVLPGSLATKSRQAIQSEIQFIQANWPGAISPEAALATLHGGSAEGLIRSYQNDVAKAWRIVRRLQLGDGAMMSFGTRFDPKAPDWSQVIDPTTGQQLVDPMTGMPIPPPLGAMVPGWMPGPQDSVPIWRQVIGDYMKTEHFEGLDHAGQENFYLIWDALDHKEQERAAQQAAQQMMQAQSLGMGNAGAPQMPPPMPDRAGFTPENSSPAPEPSQ